MYLSKVQRGVLEALRGGRKTRVELGAQSWTLDILLGRGLIQSHVYGLGSALYSLTLAGKKVIGE